MLQDTDLKIDKSVINVVFNANAQVSIKGESSSVFWAFQVKLH